MNTTRFLFFPALLAALMLSGCASTQEQASEPGGATVQVTNRNWVSMAVEVAGQSRRVRLGRVASGKTRRFSIPASLLSGATPLRFLMEPSSAERDVISEAFIVTPGEEIILVIPNMR